MRSFSTKIDLVAIGDHPFHFISGLQDPISNTPFQVTRRATDEKIGGDFGQMELFGVDPYSSLLPIRTKPFEGEYIDSWISRLARQYGFSSREFLRKLANICNKKPVIWTMDFLSRIERLIGISAENLVQMTFIRDPEVVLGIAFLDKAWRKTVVRNPCHLTGQKKHWVPVGICLRCIAEVDPPFLRRNWMRSWVESCDQHLQPLYRECLMCDHVFDTRDIDSLLEGSCSKCSSNIKYWPIYSDVRAPEDRFLFSKMLLDALDEDSFIWKEEQVVLSENLSREIACFSDSYLGRRKGSADVFILMPMAYRPRGRKEYEIEKSVNQECKQLSLFQRGYVYAAEVIDAVLEINPECNGIYNDAYLFMEEHRHRYPALEHLWKKVDKYYLVANSS